MSQNRRNRKRTNLSFYLVAKDAATLNIMGNVIDISPSGFLLLSDKHYELGSEYSVNIELPEAIDNCQLINCICRVQRSLPSSNPDFYDIGFDIIYASSPTKAIIERIQAKWNLQFP